MYSLSPHETARGRVDPHETARGQLSSHLILDPQAGTVGTTTKNNATSSYKVDEVCSDKLSQEEVYAAGQLPQLVDAVMCGYHATVFAYGQTGSGKTFTMEVPAYVNYWCGTAVTRPVWPCVRTGLPIQAGGERKGPSCRHPEHT